MQATATTSEQTDTWTRTCQDCGVRVTYAEGFDIPDDAPAGWTEDGGAWTCLSCQRHEARFGGDPAARDERIDGELRRGTGLHEIVRATGANQRQIRARRVALAKSGELAPHAHA